MVNLRAPRGMNDLFPEQMQHWRTIELAIHHIFSLYGFAEIRTPLLEELALFKRGVGEGTDIVEKEMFLVPDGEHSYCLRPENTASVVRALIERGGLSQESQEKLYYLGPMFRKERPQKGRLRQFHQFGIETIGVAEPVADLEIIVMVDHLFKILELDKITLTLNSLGSKEDRIKYKEKLYNYLLNYESSLCQDCKRRLEQNTLRVLDCKNPQCQAISQEAPKTLDLLSEAARLHFEELRAGLTKRGIAFVLNPRLVRGLDYYNHTVFEFVADFGLGAQNTVAGGGRYDGLFKSLGNKFDLPSIGCAGGIERMVLLLEEKEAKSQAETALISLIGADDQGHDIAQDLAFSLRTLGLAADFSLTKKSLKAQMRRADKLAVRFIAVIGENENKNKTIIIKGMKSEINREIALDSLAIAEFLKSQL
jgi:histidyl-tRNA synthetase